MPFEINVAIVNETAGYIVAHDHYDSDAESRGDVFRAARSEYGKCVSKVYVDRLEGGKPLEIGWVFQKKVEYSDVPQEYLQEAWVTLVELSE